MNSVDFKKEIEARMSRDIEGVAPLIYSKLNAAGLSGYSTFFYFLPLIDAENEKSQIISGSIGGKH
jgi:hypothetical protein